MKRLLFFFAAISLVIPFLISGLGLAEVGNDCKMYNGKVNIKKVDKRFAGEDVLAVFVLRDDGNIEVKEGPITSFKKPKKNTETPIDQQPPSSKSIDRGEIPLAIEDDISASTVKKGTITTYVGDTCANINGTWYCW